MTKAALKRIEKTLRKNNPGMEEGAFWRLMGEIDSPLARISTYKCLLRGNHSDPQPEAPYSGKGGKLLLASDIEFICDESTARLHKICAIDDIIKYGRQMGADG